MTFCTGGIRCEKAAPFLLQQGFEQVYQLDGGILKYFEECGSDHFDGECFVFDKRVGLAADLDESGHGLCFACQSLLTAEELADPLLSSKACRARGATVAGGAAGADHSRSIARSCGK